MITFSVEHIGLAARDPTALAEWYQRVLAAKLVFKVEQTPPAYFLKLPGGLTIEIYKGDFSVADTSVNRLTGWRHVALRVQSIESARDQLIAEGVDFPEAIKPAGGAGRILFFQDSEGNLLHLVERPEGFPIGP